ncbi:MAG: hypothetical protein ACR2OM_03600 [Aestuariivirgaceae bacterium]
MIPTNGLRSTLLVVVMVLFAGLPLRAAEEPAVVKALYDTFEELGGERPSHQSLSSDADGTITITGLKLLMQNFQQDGEDVRQDLTADSMVLKDVSTLSEGLFEVGTMTTRNAVISVTTPQAETIRMTVPVVEAKGAFIRAPNTLKTSLDRMFAQSFLAKSATTPLVTISAGQWSMDVHDLKFSWNGDPKTFMGESTYSVGSIQLPASMLADAGMSPSMKDLGYEDLDFGATGRADMQLPKEHIEVEGDTSLLARDMGAFSISAMIGGIQPSLLEAAQAVQEAPNSIDMNAMMVMLQTITVGHLKFRYDDASLAERLLAWYEKTENKTRDQIIAEIVATSDFGLVALNSPELSAQVKTAIDTFLRKPGWIQFELRPATPVPASQIMPLIGTPAEVVKLLNPSVTAGANGE